MHLQPRATIDFETRSTVSLKKVGTWRYSQHPTTEVLCLVFRLPHWPVKKTSLWHPAFPVAGLEETYNSDDLAELFDWITSDNAILEAHNAWFERCVWQHIMVTRYGFPAIQSHQWRCSAAKAAAVSYPRALDDALKAARVALRKDAEGSKVMKKMTKPRKPRKAERLAWVGTHGDTKHPVLYWETPELFEQLFAYCRQDVLAEEGLSYVLPDLSPRETELYLLDQRINERGFQLDREAVSAALVLLSRETEKLNKELAILTKGQVTKATQRASMLLWLSAEEELDLPDTKAETIDGVLSSGRELTANARRGLEIMRTLGRSSTAKYQSMKNWMGRDGRVRGGLLFHGASTGRWTGSGIQPHNFPKGTLKEDSEPNQKVDVARLWRLLKGKNTRPIMNKYHATIMEALAHALRGAIIAKPGYELFVADFAAIEARVVLWLADDEDALDIFRQNKDIYCDMASSIYGYSINKQQHPTERGMGKIAILGLGYQMGWAKFQDTCARYGITIDDEFSQLVVETYREKYWRVKQLWADQEAAAIRAVTTKRLQVCGHVTWIVEGAFLFCILPSGRRLAYPNPEVRQMTTSWGAQKQTLTFMGINPKTRQWHRQTTYGGMLVENITQAVARDILAEAIERCENSGVYLPVLSVHDEVIAEVSLGHGTLPAFDKLMKTVPRWAKGCPVEADSWCGTRYQKS